MMEQREKLIELIKDITAHPTTLENDVNYIITNGVVVLPCRCCECKHWGKHDDVDVPGETERIKGCEWAFWMIGDNGFCSYGERKEVIQK